MMPVIQKSIFSDLLEVIMAKPTDYSKLLDTLNNTYRVYSSITNIMIDDIKATDIYLNVGKAISPSKAAHCLLEQERTAVFIRGIFEAILSLKRQTPNNPIHILYAGCGPYASLLTPFTAIFDATELRFHLMDINPTSINAVKTLYRELGIMNYVTKFSVADASTYTLSDSVDLVISETMLNALREEPQVAIMHNIIGQLKEEALFIPQAIHITACLTTKKEETKYLLANEDFTASRNLLGIVYSIGQTIDDIEFYGSITIPEETNEDLYLCLLTEIVTFGNQKLGIYASSLNTPHYLCKAYPYRGKVIRFSYEINAEPGLRMIVSEELTKYM